MAPESAPLSRNVAEGTALRERQSRREGRPGERPEPAGTSGQGTRQSALCPTVDANQHRRLFVGLPAAGESHIGISQRIEGEGEREMRERLQHLLPAEGERRLLLFALSPRPPPRTNSPRNDVNHLIVVGGILPRRRRRKTPALPGSDVAGHVRIARLRHRGDRTHSDRLRGDFQDGGVRGALTPAKRPPPTARPREAATLRPSGVEDEIQKSPSKRASFLAFHGYLITDLH